MMDAPEYKKLLQQFPQDRSYMIRMLHALQNNHPQQYITNEAMAEVCCYLNLTMAQVCGTASYYSMFSFQPRGKYIIRICKSPVCQMMDSNNLVSWIQDRLNIRAGETSKDGLFSLELSECLGHCDGAPMMMINDEVYKDFNAEKLESIIKKLGKDH